MKQFYQQLSVTDKKIEINKWQTDGKMNEKGQPNRSSNFGGREILLYKFQIVLLMIDFHFP